MNIQYTYTITKLWAYPETINGFDNVVLNIFFDITATDTVTGNTGIFSGVENIEPPEEGSSNFINYDSLSEEQVIEWLITSLGESRLEPMKEQARNEITTETALPWA
jgi:hypothetical protein